MCTCSPTQKNETYEYHPFYVNLGSKVTLYLKIYYLYLAGHFINYNDFNEGDGKNNNVSMEYVLMKTLSPVSIGQYIVIKHYYDRTKLGNP